MKLHLFNPDNDLALAANVADYTPPRSVHRFREALAAIPAWLAQPGDNLYAPGVTPQWLASKGLDVGLDPVGDPEPWGWSAAAAEFYRRLKIPGPFPDIERIRSLSHRRSALNLYRALEGRLPYPLPPAPMEIRSTDELPETDRIMLKSPWSCSGRGVVDCEGMTSANIRRRADDAIRRQGSVMVEPKLRKLTDFAMLYSGGRFAGLSLFYTSGPAAYAGNIVDCDEGLAARIGAEWLRETAEAVEACLPKDYRGPLGVDMMVYETDDHRRLICPTVEINFRKTMGFVARALYRRLGPGRFAITAAPTAPGLALIPPSPNFSATFLPD